MDSKNIKWIKTKEKGLRYYEHPTRQYGNGVGKNKKKDRCYSIVFRIKGDKKIYSYGMGWWSEGIPGCNKRVTETEFESYCLSEMNFYKANIVSGNGPKSPKEKRKMEEENRQAVKEAEEREKRENLTFADIWKEYHGEKPEDKSTKKKGQAPNEENIIYKRKLKKYIREDQLYRLWIAPVIGKMRIKEIAKLNLKALLKKMEDAGKSPRTIQYSFAVIRQVYNYAKENKQFSGELPTYKFKLPKVDNERRNFLTPEKAHMLLQALKAKSQDTYGIALLSFQCGLRFGEIAHLKWSDVDYGRGLLLILDAKAGTRNAFITEQVSEMLKSREQGKPSDLIFPAKTGGVMPRISPTFYRVVKELGLNEGIDDRRQKLVFHSARHSFGSLLAEQGQDLYTIQKLIGHKTVTMTQRYSHLTENKLKNAVESLGKAFERTDNIVDFPGAIKQEE